MPLTLFPYFGGKYFMANKLYPLFPEHRIYAEPFGGSGVVLLSKKESKIEIFNDISKDITTLFKVVRNHPESFYREMDKCLVSRDEFNRLVKTDPDTLTDFQRAYRFLYIQKMSFAGIDRANPCFKADTSRRVGINFRRIQGVIDSIYKRLMNVIIENLDYEELIRRYDCEDTFFFCDPPYLDTVQLRKKEYKHTFYLEDFERFAAVVKAIRGKFLITLNEAPEVRELFAGFNIKSHEHIWPCSNTSGNKLRSVNELLISNYKK